MSRTKGSGNRDPGVIYAGPDSARDIYHTTRECPYVVPGFHVIQESDPRAAEYRENYRQCMWCRYDASDVLELDS